jgi:hypothetical protein
MAKREHITHEQYEVLEVLLEDHDIITEQIMEEFSITCLSDMPKKKFIPTLKRIINLRDLYKSLGNNLVTQNHRAE